MTEEPPQGFLWSKFKDNGGKAPWWYGSIYDRMCLTCGAPEGQHSHEGFCPDRAYEEEKVADRKKELNMR
jgi:hypothetical protein